MGASVVLEASAPMSRLPDLADRIERLLLRHEEQKRTNALLEQQLRAVSEERDNLRSRLAAARARVDALIDRLPAAEAAAIAEGASTDGAADANNRSTPA
jgi:cell division protein ZapB